MGGYASLPTGMFSTLSNFTIASWVKVGTLANWARIFDFGTGTTSYMFLTADAGSTNALRFAITTSGGGGEQQLNGPAITANIWTHIAITVVGNTGTLYVNGAAVATNTGMTLHPSNLGNTNQNYLGKSQYSADPALQGNVDDLRIFNSGLSAAQITQLYNSYYPPTVAIAAWRQSGDRLVHDLDAFLAGGLESRRERTQVHLVCDWYSACPSDIQRQRHQCR